MHLHSRSHRVGRLGGVAPLAAALLLGVAACGGAASSAGTTVAATPAGPAQVTLSPAPADTTTGVPHFLRTHYGIGQVAFTTDAGVVPGDGRLPGDPVPLADRGPMGLP